MTATAESVEAHDKSHVVDEFKEDYAQERVPVAYRTWTNKSLFGVMFGITTAMVFLSWGGILARTFGGMPFFIGMIIGTVFIGGLSIVFSYRASRTGLGAELVTRSSGFGFLGSIPTSLIYGLALIMYFAFEGGIMVNAVHTFFSDIPKALIVIVCCALFIPLAIYGMKLMNIVMWITLPLYVIFMGFTIFMAVTSGKGVNLWTYTPASMDNSAGPPLFQIIAATMAFGTQVALSADTGRFIKPKTALSGSFIVAGVSQLLVFMGCSLLGGWLALQFDEADPGVYLPALLGIWGVLFVVVTQVRINVVNVYGASIALSTIFSRIFNFSPGRHVWVVVTITLSTVAMLTDIYAHLTAVMTFAGIFILAWIMAVFADTLWIRWIFKWQTMDFAPYRKGTLADFNPVGISAVAISIIIGVPLGLGMFGPFGVTLAPYLAGAIPLIVVPVVALMTKAQYSSPDDREPVLSPTM